MASIDLKNIAHSYDPTAKDPIFALQPFNLHWEDGGTYALLGPSGCGKSTLLHILGTLDKFDSGKLKINSEIINHKKDYSKFRSENIGFVFQFHHLLV